MLQTRIKVDFAKHGTKLKKKQGTRLLKTYCEKCGYTVRVTSKWLATGMPRCGIAKHGRMVCDDFEGEGEE